MAQYKLDFLLMHQFRYDISYFDDRMPFEKDVYINLLLQHLDNEKMRKQQQRNR